MPFSAPSLCAFISAQISFSVASLFSSQVRSTTDTSEVGTRKDMPLSFLFSSGITTPTASAAAPVLVARAVHCFLGGGRRMHGGHQAALDAPFVVEHLGHGRQAVGGA